MTHVPIRIRITLAFAAVIAVLLIGTGAFLYVRLGTTLTAAVDNGLRTRLSDVIALAAQSDPVLTESRRSPLTEQGESLTQILDASGRVVDATPEVRDRPLLDRAQIRAAARGTLIARLPPGGDDRDELRVLATPAGVDGRGRIVVVATSLEAVQEAQQALGQQLLVGGPALLLVACLACYAAAGGALRPIESMRRRAAALQAGEAGQRLPVPPAHDEVGRLGETLNAMLARIDDAFLRERAFVADASHELRTPLAILKAELELALAHASDVPTFRAAVASAAEETDRVVQLAEDLLVIARSDQGRLPVTSRPIPVLELVESTARRYAARAGELTAAAPADLIVDADPLRIEQALGNLVDNALRHGAGAVRLTAEAGERDEVLIRVTDEGPGFPADFLPVAFERFTRADTARSRGGSGLGLAIVRAIVAAHGGRVSAHDRPGGGAEVRLVLRRSHDHLIRAGQRA